MYDRQRGQPSSQKGQASAMPSVNTISSASSYSQATSTSTKPNFIHDNSSDLDWTKVRLGSADSLISFRDFEVEKALNPAFKQFCSQLGLFLENSLPALGYPVPSNANGRRFKFFEPEELVCSFLTICWDFSSQIVLFRYSHTACFTLITSLYVTGRFRLTIFVHIPTFTIDLVTTQ